MGFLTANLPKVDVATWRTLTLQERMKATTRHIAEAGMGYPGIFYIIYAVKIGLYIFGGMCFALATDGIDGWNGIGTWWAEPIVFQKVVLWSLLFEVLGLGCGFGPLTGKIAPPMGSPLYWFRTGTIRLPPWPRWIPFTSGHRRTWFEIVAYAALLAAVLTALLADGSGPDSLLGTTVGALPTPFIVAVLAPLAVIGLRDKTIFLAARGEVYGALTVTFLFAGPNMIVGAKLVMLAVWLGAATSKLNLHFPFVVATMMSNNPLVQPKWLKRKFFRSFPDDLRPGRIPHFLAHFGTAVEMGVPLALFLSGGGGVTMVAAFIMVAFHLVILTAIPLGVPLEWNVFMIFGVFALFVTHADIGPRDVTQPWPITALMAVIVGTVIIGNFYPRKVSFLPGMRYYAGNWDNSQWFLTETACQKIADKRIGLGLLQHKQIAKFSGPDDALVAIELGYGFRAMFAHGRALFTLWDHVIPPGRHNDYAVLEGETFAGYALGWNFGCGHLHNEQLIAAVQHRCNFDPGELRVLILDAQPIHRQRQEYRIVDAATGELERGFFRVADVVDRQPWDHTIPVTLLDSRVAGLQ